MGVLLANFVLLFAINIGARSNGSVYFNGGLNWYKTYWYDSDESALNDGAIAKFAHKSGDTVYVKTWQMLTTIGGDTENGADEITLISKDSKISISSGLDGSIAGHSFTVNGNGITVEVSAPLIINGSDNGHITLKNITVSNTTSQSAVLSVGKDTAGPSVTLDNACITGLGSYLGGVLLANSSDIELKNGASVKNADTVNGESNNYTGVILKGKNPSLKMYSDSLIESYGDAVCTLSKANVTIDGGKLHSVNGRAICVSSGSEATVNGGECLGGGIAVAQVCDGLLTVNGGSFYALDNGNGMRGVIVSGDKDANGGSAVINAGNFYDVSSSADWIFDLNESKDGKASLVLKSATTFGNYRVYSGNNGEGAIKTATLVLGASIRTQKDSSGIRFQSRLEKSSFAAIEMIDENAEIGTAIVPFEYLEKTGGIFTRDALLGAGFDCLEIPCDKGFSDKGSEYLINAAMTNVKTKNYARDFVAVPYVSFNTADGATVNAYGEFNKNDNVRNVVRVAYSALSDVLVEGDAVSGGETVTKEYAKKLGYGNTVTEWYEYDEATGIATLMHGVAYTEYSTAQREVIRGYIDTYEQMKAKG